MDILEQIAAFHGVLPRQKSLEEVTAWWARVEGIEAAIATDPRASAYETLVAIRTYLELARPSRPYNNR